MAAKTNPSGIVVGMAGPGRTWVLERDEHVLLIGATRSGKSRRIILPTIGVIGSVGRESMIINDMKGELYDHTAAWLRDRCGYDVIRIDYRDPTGNRTNPVAAVVDALQAGRQDDAAAIARNIAYTIVYGDRAAAAPTDPMWQKAQTSLITGLILAIAEGQPPPGGGMKLREDPWTWPTEEEKHMGSVYASLVAGGSSGKRLDEWLAQFDPDHPASLAYGSASLAMDKTKSSILTGASTDLNLFGDSFVRWLTAVQDHDLSATGKRPTAVFLIIPDESETRHPLVTLYIQQALQALVALANSKGGRLPVRVNFLLDEFGNLPPLKGFEHTVTMALGRGIKLCLVVQSLTQLKEQYKDSAETITGNCGTWIYLRTQDVKTMETISAMCGKYTTYGESNSTPKVYWTSSSTPGHATNTMSLMSRPLVTPDELRRWPLDTSLVVQIGCNPAKLPLPDLKAWAGIFPRIQEKAESPKPKPMESVPVWRPPLPKKAKRVTQSEDQGNGQEPGIPVEAMGSAGNEDFDGTAGIPADQLGNM